jgi:hypothetical protein
MKKRRPLSGAPKVFRRPHGIGTAPKLREAIRGGLRFIK